MLAISNNELDECNNVGGHVKCPHCGKKRVVRYGETILKDGTREPNNTLGFVKCGKKCYLVAINGKEPK